MRLPTGKEAEERRLKNACIGCGDEHPGVDLETGFAQRFCRRCRVLPEFQQFHPGQVKGDTGWRQRHKAEGLDNLDRLTGKK